MRIDKFQNVRNMGETFMSGRRNNRIFCCRTNGGKFNHRFEWNFKLKLASGQGASGVKLRVASAMPNAGYAFFFRFGSDLSENGYGELKMKMKAKRNDNEDNDSEYSQ